MKALKKISFTAACFFLLFSLQAQKTDTLDFELFLSLVKMNHPVVKLAGLQTERGKAAVMLAKGAFDPNGFSYLNNKFYSGKEYFNYLDGGIKAHTRLGVEVKAAYENNRGYYISPDETVPSAGLYSAGISVPVLQGMLIDKQRAALREAKIISKATLEEQKKMVNELLLDACSLYWEWAALNNQLDVYRDAINFSKTRLSGIKQSVALGDRPAIDTVETLIQLQNFEYSYNQTLILLVQKSYELSVFLWDEKEKPLMLNENSTCPLFKEMNFIDYLSADSLNNVLNTLRVSHPEMKLYEYKLSQLNVEKKWKTEKLKPKFNLQYNFLSQDPATTPFSVNNYKWGLEFAMPLFLRQERADLKMTRLKMKETGYNFSLKETELSAKVNSNYKKCRYLQDQITLMKNVVNNYSRMLDAEKTNFDSGESSVFLVNSREIALVQAELKLIESQSKFKQALIGYYYACGTLHKQTKL